MISKIFSGDKSQMNYYVRIGSKAFGPFPEQDVLNLIAQERINKSSLISTNGMNWRTAGEYPEFFPKEEELPPPQEEEFNPFSTIWDSPFTQDFNDTPAAENTPVVEPKIWYVSRDGRQGLGPYATQTIINMLQQKQLTAESYVWKQGEQARFFSQEPFFHMFLYPKKNSDEKLPFWKSNAVSKEGKKIAVTYTVYIFSYLGTAVFALLGLLFLLPGLVFQIGDLMTTACVFLFLALVGCNVCSVISLILLYHFWVAVQPYGARTTPGKAIGFCFIPFFNLYWIFVCYCSLAQDMNRFLAEGGEETRASEGLALVYCIILVIPFLPLIAVLAFQPLVNASFKRAALALTER